MLSLLVLMGIATFWLTKQSAERLNIFFRSRLSTVIIKKQLDWSLQNEEFLTADSIWVTPETKGLSIGDSIEKTSDSKRFRYYQQDSTGRYYLVGILTAF